MTDDERAFLAAIFAAPEDDTPRLVYADWLEENGRADRADLIRVQCWLEQSRGRMDIWSERVRWAERREDVLEEVAPRVAAALPPFPGVTWGPVVRGFVDTATLDLIALRYPEDPDDGAAAIPDFLGHAPLVTLTVRFDLFPANERRTGVRELLAWPGVGGVPRLALRPQGTPATAAAREFVDALLDQNWGPRPGPPEPPGPAAAVRGLWGVEVTYRPPDWEAWPHTLDLRAACPLVGGELARLAAAGRSHPFPRVVVSPGLGRRAIGDLRGRFGDRLEVRDGYGYPVEDE